MFAFEQKIAFANSGSMTGQPFSICYQWFTDNRLGHQKCGLGAEGILSWGLLDHISSPLFLSEGGRFLCVR